MTSDIHFQRHILEWTPEKISRFWDYESQNIAKRGLYFTQQVGGALVRFVQHKQALAEPVLDYGAGLGYLTEKIVEQGLVCDACDFSPESVASIRQKLKDRSGFRKCELLTGLPSTLPAGEYGTVFLVETLEHLIAGWKESTLKEIWRVLRPGGLVVVTVPHAEDLEASQVICADCGAVFHRVQHVAAYNAQTLTATMQAAGFRELACEPCCLVFWTDELQQPGRRLRRGLRRVCERLHLVKPRPKPTPNLVYIGRKDV